MAYGKEYFRQKYWANREAILNRRNERRRANPLKNRYKRIKERARKRLHEYLSWQEFFQWFSNQEKRCVYCGDDDPTRYKPHRKFNVDRKDSFKGYTIDNICLACWNCNRLKNDYFTFDEFREIADKYIKPKITK